MFTHGLMQRRAAWMRRLAMSLTLAVGFLPLTPLLPAAQAQGTLPPASPVHSLLQFPSSLSAAATTDPAAPPPSDLTTRLDDAIKLRLTLVGNYNVTSYSRFLPSVQRALGESADGGLTDADVRGPFDGAGGQKIAALVGTDAYLIVTITSYNQNATTRRVSLGVASRIFYSQTGQPVEGLAIATSGVAGPASASDSDEDIQQGAINDAASKVVSSFNAAMPQAKIAVATSSQRGNGRGTAYVLGAILIGALLYAVISGSHFGSSGGSSSGSGVAASTTTTGNPPNPPVVTTGTGTGTGTGTPTPPAPPTSSARHR